jgi:hypothetical protein
MNSTFSVFSMFFVRQKKSRSTYFVRILAEFGVFVGISCSVQVFIGRKEKKLVRPNKNKG